METVWALAGGNACDLAGVALGLNLLGVALGGATGAPPDLETGREQGLGKIPPVLGPAGEAVLRVAPEELDPLKAPAASCDFAMNVPAALKDLPCCRAPVLFGRRVIA